VSESLRIKKFSHFFQKYEIIYNPVALCPMFNGADNYIEASRDTR
jgi:hypothetical protein